MGMCFRGNEVTGKDKSKMPKDDLIEMKGVIVDALGGGQYSIQPDDGKVAIRARLGGKMKLSKIRVIAGDKVTVSVSPYDLTHGIITWRLR